MDTILTAEFTEVSCYHPFYLNSPEVQIGDSGRDVTYLTQLFVQVRTVADRTLVQLRAVHFNIPLEK